MPRRKPKLYLRFRTLDGRQPNCPVVDDSKSRLRPFWCLVNGVPEHHLQGVYYHQADLEKTAQGLFVLRLPERPDVVHTRHVKWEHYGTSYELKFP